MKGTSETNGPDYDDSNEVYASANDTQNHVTSPSQPPTDNLYSYAYENNQADTGRGKMTDNILYGTAE